jgi:hypothetical protein
VKDLIGQRFGRLTIMKYLGRLKKNRRVYWLALCDCGKEKEIGSNALGCTASCGCARGRWKYSGTDASFEDFFRHYKANAKTRGRRFDLSKDEFRKITSSDCVYCGTQPISVYQRRGGVKKVLGYAYNGIDRSDNSLDYVSGNCVPCCTLCNLMKRALTKATFLYHVAQIVSHQEKMNGRYHHVA